MSNPSINTSTSIIEDSIKEENESINNSVSLQQLESKDNTPNSLPLSEQSLQNLGQIQLTRQKKILQKKGKKIEDNFKITLTDLQEQFSSCFSSNQSSPLKSDSNILEQQQEDENQNYHVQVNIANHLGQIIIESPKKKVKRKSQSQQQILSPDIKLSQIEIKNDNEQQQEEKKSDDNNNNDNKVVENDNGVYEQQIQIEPSKLEIKSITQKVPEFYLAVVLEVDQQQQEQEQIQEDQKQKQQQQQYIAVQKLYNCDINRNLKLNKAKGELSFVKQTSIEQAIKNNRASSQQDLSDDEKTYKMKVSLENLDKMEKSLNNNNNTRKSISNTLISGKRMSSLIQLNQNKKQNLAVLNNLKKLE